MSCQLSNVYYAMKCLCNHFNLNLTRENILINVLFHVLVCIVTVDQNLNNPFFPIDCDRRFKGSYELNIHRRRKHYHPQQYKCPLCLISFDTIKTYAKHCDQEHFGDTIECPLCKEKFEEKVIAAQHMILHGQNAFDCDKCDMSFIKQNYLAAHHITC